MKSVVTFAHSLHNFLSQPMKVFWACMAFVIVSLVMGGNLLRLYGLHRDHGRLTEQILQVKGQIFDIDKQLRLAQDPSFIERQALDRYDLAEENDLIFVFADE